jgi:DMSO/TMAO reductase YedYZ molybdopterin-dependent catalytic subunit
MIRRAWTSLRDGAGLAGLVAMAVVLVVQALLHTAFHEAPFAPYSAAEWVIRQSPGPLATYAIDNFGHRAQSVLTYSLIASALALGFLVGRRPAWVLALLAGGLTLVAAYLDPMPQDIAGVVASAFVAGLTGWLTMVAVRRLPASTEGEATEPERVNWSRRQFLARTSLGFVLVGVFGAAFARSGSRSTPTGPVRADSPATVPADSAFASVPGLSPQVTPREDHYVVDINVQDPLISESGWRLKVDGEVATPLSLSLDELRAMATEERINNLTCISNRVGGGLIGNSRWTGVSLDALLDMARPKPGAVTLVAEAFDGFTDGIRLDEIRGQGALIAIGMNGLLLSRDHGFPARLLFPDHYGMRNVKWLTRLELKAEDEEGYWAKRGWDREAVIRTSSRIDVPGDGETVAPTFVCAGVAWAGARGIEAVEVSTDDGESWRGAQLETELGTLSWRRWRIDLEISPGDHVLTVRATDGSGRLQDAEERERHPSGASGYHRIEVKVAG